MRIVHFADVHLDRPFVDLSLGAARQRRSELRSAFECCLDAALEHDADMVTIGGDLWEDEHVTPDTRKRFAAQLGELGRRPRIGNERFLYDFDEEGQNRMPARIEIQAV